MTPETRAKYERLVGIIRELGSVAVAFSGGVDSTFLARAAREALGDRALLVTADSETYPFRELEGSRRLAGFLAMRHVVVETRELDNPEYVRNPPNRCFFCKEELFTRVQLVAEREGVAHIIYGANIDDLGDHRPGMQAAQRMGVRAPMIEAELTKSEIRELSRDLGLPTWDKPSFACLSSRFQYGDTITAAKLRRVEAAEACLRGLGFSQFRVRHHDALVRLELPLEDIGRLWGNGLREAITERLKELGYVYVTVDLQGFRSGSGNEALGFLSRGRRGAEGEP